MRRLTGSPLGLGGDFARIQQWWMEENNDLGPGFSKDVLQPARQAFRKEGDSGDQGTASSRVLL